MPNAQNNTKVNARRFAALLAGFDLGNTSEEEALAKARVLRRMAADAGMRLVDVMELPDVKQAIDEQLHPAREESAELRDALQEAAALREELTERTRDVRKLADLLRQREEEASNAGRGQCVSGSDLWDTVWGNQVIGAITCALGWIIGNMIWGYLH